MLGCKGASPEMIGRLVGGHPAVLAWSGYHRPQGSKACGDFWGDLDEAFDCKLPVLLMDAMGGLQTVGDAALQPQKSRQAALHGTSNVELVLKIDALSATKLIRDKRLAPLKRHDVLNCAGIQLTAGSKELIIGNRVVPSRRERPPKVMVH